MKVDKKELFYIPNLLTYLRIILIPVIMVLYLNYHDIAALICLCISMLGDFLDGKIARRYHQVSELGILLDPVADKFTQGMIVICMCIRYPVLWWLFGIEAVKEFFMIFAGAYTIRRYRCKLGGASWYGKVGTGVTDFTLLAFMLFPNMPDSVRTALMIFCAAWMVLTLSLYARSYVRIWHGHMEGTIPVDDQKA